MCIRDSAKAASRTGLKLSAAKITHGHEQAEILSVTVSPQYSGSAAPSGRVTIKGSTIDVYKRQVLRSLTLSCRVELT